MGTYRREAVAAIAIALAGFGCGEVKAFSDAALPADGAVELSDAGPPDATPRGVVNVQVNTFFSPAGPQSGVTVVFVEPDGKVAERKLTDGEGKASATLTSGGSVTVARLDTATQLITVLGVEAGDTLLFGDALDPDQTATGTVNVTFTRTVHPNHVLHTTCGVSSNAPNTVATEPMARWCDRTPRDMVLEASGNASAVPVYAILKDQTAANITVPNDQWNGAGNGKVMLTAVPADVKSLTAVRHYRSGGMPMFVSFTEAPINTDGKAAFSFDLDPALAAGDEMLNVTRFADDITLRGVQVVRETTAINASYGVDVASELLPWVYATKLDFATRTLTWTQTGTGAFDAMVADFGYSRPDGENVKTYSWRVISPTATGTLALPTLPPELGDVAPKTGDTLLSRASVYLIRHGDETYAQLRQHLDRDDGIFNADGGDLPLKTKLTVSRFVCGRGCGLQQPP